MTKKTLSVGDEAARALRISEERPRRGEGGSRLCRSQSKLSRGYAFCANQVTTHSSPCDECSSSDCEDKRWDCRRDSDESKTPKARVRSESEGSTGTTTVDFYARQVCCRECG
ncbi:uncharacterized protein LOC112552971 [Pogonomyrmex barbatus]|uniref:Uncharacterized protein LOC112552971 n=1 Tax=Pogonomyrmex barbatus TaxID=144034 RepID=A0A8N1SBK6_9HYME|nr:uncharacterized protein LOC112552971 [Pogonomyrmex barbatus]